MMGCKKCSVVGAVLFLLVGLLFLLKDLEVWTFWGINWWTALFLLWGVLGLGMSSCLDCCAVNNKKK